MVDLSDLDEQTGSPVGGIQVPSLLRYELHAVKAVMSLLYDDGC